jgi:hypothetical protein
MMRWMILQRGAMRADIFVFDATRENVLPIDPHVPQAFALLSERISDLNA